MDKSCFEPGGGAGPGQGSPGHGALPLFVTPLPRAGGTGGGRAGQIVFIVQNTLSLFYWRGTRWVPCL